MTSALAAGFGAARRVPERRARAARPRESARETLSARVAPGSRRVGASGGVLRGGTEAGPRRAPLGHRATRSRRRHHRYRRRRGGVREREYCVARDARATAIGRGGRAARGAHRGHEDLGGARLRRRIHCVAHRYARLRASLARRLREAVRRTARAHTGPAAGVPQSGERRPAGPRRLIWSSALHCTASHHIASPSFSNRCPYPLLSSATHAHTH